jgi:hypothetical protein
VSLVLDLPEWTKRTAQISPEARQVRQALLRASDPHRVLFMDLPALLATSAQISITDSIARCIAELYDAYPKMLRSVESQVLKMLDHTGSSSDLANRGRTVSGISGDFRLDAFALRLASYSETLDDVEAMISLSVNKPARDWTDRDIELAYVQLGTWAFEFRKVETLAPLRDRPATRHAFAVVFGAGDGHPATSRSFDIASTDLQTVRRLAKQISASASGVGLHLFLAALAEAGSHAAQQDRRR